MVEKHLKCQYGGTDSPKGVDAARAKYSNWGNITKLEYREHAHNKSTGGRRDHGKFSINFKTVARV